MLKLKSSIRLAYSQSGPLPIHDLLRYCNKSNVNGVTSGAEQ
jgi:hypothetical protein